ncbi:MAG TPA: hypothetical protein VHB98_22660, partial [Chloroflexota bacterium]|nr:hypothetical protein [Chloroflexota bacterium]
MIASWLARARNGGALILLALAVLPGGHVGTAAYARESTAGPTTATPIQHLVVIYQENVSF